MRESRPYGSERGAFSNGRPYRDQTSDLFGAGRRGLDDGAASVVEGLSAESAPPDPA